MEIQCKICYKTFEAHPCDIKRGRKYCSSRCYWESLKNSLKGEGNPHYKGKINKKCLTCRKIFEVHPNSFARKRIFCSLTCYKKAVITPDKTCLVCGKTYHRRGRKGRKGKFCSRECGRLHRLQYPIRYWLGKKRENLSKEKNPAWRGGITPLSRLLRSTFKFKEWRRKVFERDNYTCQSCLQKGGFLEPHHMKNVASCPGLAFDIHNGMTLCLNCHRKIDKWRH